MKIYVVTHHFMEAVSRTFRDFGEVKLLPKDYGRLDADLVIFTGGEDINPRYYKAANTSAYGWYDNPRDKWEMAVAKDILNGKILTKKVLGICRGHQLLNVIMGGTLVQDIPTYFGKGHESVHDLSWVMGNKFQGIFDSVNSLHHQGIEVLGEKASPRVLGYEPSTRIHEIVLWSNKFLGVQFHPEFMGETGRKGAAVIAGWVNGDSLLDGKMPEFDKKSRKIKMPTYWQAEEATISPGISLEEAGRRFATSASSFSANFTATAFPPEPVNPDDSDESDESDFDSDDE